MATEAELNAQLRALAAELAQVRAEIARLEPAYLASGANAERLAVLAQRQTAILNQQDALITEINLQFPPRPTASSGQVAQDDAAAAVSGAVVQNPATPPQILTPSGRIETAPTTSPATNADTSPAPNGVDTGTNAPVRPISQTQSVSGLATAQQAEEFFLGTPADAGNIAAGTTATQAIPGGGSPGVGAPSDDRGNKKAVGVEIDDIFASQKIIPQANILDQYASYTYLASVYLMDRASYEKLLTTKKKSLDGAQLLFQSGGAPVRARNKYFTNDYYIDRIQLSSFVAGRGTNAAHNVNDIRMTVVEPNGISFLNNLDRAVQDYLGGAENKKKNFTNQIYLLVIRFYGYDQNGNLVRGGKRTQTNPIIQTKTTSDPPTDPEAFVEKFYPMAISNITFKVASKGVEYDIVASSPNYIVAASTNRGTVPYNIDLSGQTLKDALASSAELITTAEANANARNQPTALDPVEFSSNAGVPVNTPSPAKADAAPKNTLVVKRGLMAALNQYQQEQVGKTCTYPDIYEVEFLNPSIESAKLLKNGINRDKTRTASTSRKNAADQKLPEKQSIDYNTQVVAVVAGQQILQVLDIMLRNSTYLQDQQLAVYDPVSGQLLYNKRPANTVAWYKIGMQAIPYSPWDPIRNDYAYKIKYTIGAYKISDPKSSWFPTSQFNGVHKQYPYWFTGQNTAVLSYEQQINALYSLILSGGPGEAQLGTSNANSLIKFTAQPRSSESDAGAYTGVNEPAASLADYLYSPSDQANATMAIVGDPAWLQQGEAFAGTLLKDRYQFSAFLADGTINFDSQDILFEILFNTPTDYNLSTGLQNPDPNNPVNDNWAAQSPVPGDPNFIDPLELPAGNPSYKPPTNQATQSYVYRANSVVSEFVRGKFTQTLKGSLMTYFPTAAQQAAAQTSRDATKQATASQSLQRQWNQILTPATSLTQYSPINNPFDLSTTAAAAASSPFVNNLLGAVPTRPVPPPATPTSNGDIGLVTNPFGPAVVDGGTNAPPQQIAPSDDFLG